MEWLLHINYWLIWLLGALTLFGLYRPWLALWWLPVTNRKKVLQTYGLVALALWIVYMIMRILLYSN